jgi:hypothetical protein
MGTLPTLFFDIRQPLIGIGLEGHESPYLRGGSDVVIEVGHTFSNEPGIYIEGEVTLNRSSNS